MNWEIFLDVAAIVCGVIALLIVAGLAIARGFR